MLSNDKSVIISFNGEIYNYQQLKSELISLGYKFKSKTDTEVLIYAYQEWEINFIHKIEGMFAIALFDTKKEKLFLIRDRIGIKPLYFSTQAGYLSFASENSGSVV